MTTLPLAPAFDKAVPKTVPYPQQGQPITAITATAVTIDTTGLSLLADLLADLPVADRREVIASLP
ncbi:MAG: hypothetical protein JXN61_15880, partial [Sedimentisphaerales bacterium]|nr:hypothetical protein [Sedimentisphaerales bacterium]